MINKINGTLNVMLQNEKHQPMTLSIFNDMGQNVSMTKTREGNISIPVSELTAGIYMLFVTDENGNTKTSKFIKD